MDNPMLGRIHHHLRRARVSQTRQRDEVLVTLSKLGPCTRQDLVAALDGKADSATVYRTLAVLIQLGVVIEVRHKLVELSAPFKQHHHHLLCSGCGQEIGFNSDRLETALREVAESRSFTFDVHTHQVEVVGLCPACQK